MKKIESFVLKNRINYEEINIEIDNSLNVETNSTKISISFNEVHEIHFTKNTCILEYKNDRRIDTLLIPLNILDDKLDDFLNMLGRGKNYEQTRNY